MCSVCGAGRANARRVVSATSQVREHVEAALTGSDMSSISAMRGVGCTSLAANVASYGSKHTSRVRTRRLRAHVHVAQLSSEHAVSTSGRVDDGGIAKGTKVAPSLRRRTFFASTLALSIAALAADKGQKAVAEENFYMKWPFIEPADIIPYLEANATPGDVQSVIRGARHWHLTANITFRVASDGRLCSSPPPLPIHPLSPAMDAFAERYPMYKLTHEKGELLSGFVRDAKPKVRPLSGGGGYCHDLAFATSLLFS